MSVYSCCIYPRDGSTPRLITVLEERPDGWVVETMPGGNWDLPRDRVFMSREDWTLNEAEYVPLPELELDSGHGELTFDPTL